LGGKSKEWSDKEGLGNVTIGSGDSFAIEMGEKTNVQHYA